MERGKRMSEKILVTLPLDETQKAWLEAQADTGKQYEFIYKPDAEVTADDVKELDAVIGCVKPAYLTDAEHLSWVQLHSAGYETYAAPGVLPDGCTLCNASGAYGLAVSEHMLAMTFDLLRHFGGYHKHQEQHLWKETGLYSSVEGSTVVVLGLGDIGGDYARKVKACGAYVIGVRKDASKPKPEYVDEQVDDSALDRVLPRADILAMVVPGGPATHHILNAERLNAMKDDSIIINVGRGNAIDSAALKALLKEGKFYGVGLDVTEPEPLPADDELWDCDRVLLTPHAAGRFFLPETVKRILKIAGKNLAAWSRGEKLINVIER